MIFDGVGRLHDRLLTEYNEDADSLRFYFLDEIALRRTEHHGVAKPVGFDGAPHIVIPRTTSTDLMTGVSLVITAPVLTVSYSDSLPIPRTGGGARNCQIGGKGLVNPCGCIGLERPQSPRLSVEAAAAEHACLPQFLLLENRAVVSFDGNGEVAVDDLIGRVRE